MHRKTKKPIKSAEKEKKQINDNIITTIPKCLFINSIILGKWRIITKIGQGSFGQVYTVELLNSKEKNKTNYALKVEFTNILKISTSLLQKEAMILEKLEKEVGFAKHYSYFKENNNSYLIMSLLGDNLGILMKKCRGNFTLKTVFMTGYQLLIRMEALHEKGYLHRDLKPENIAIGGKNYYDLIYLIDFGLSKMYLTVQGKHIEKSSKKGLVGTARYTSINSHLGKELSRRDDLESLFYVLIYFANGSLPWQNALGLDKEDKYMNILKIKQNISLENLCEGLPSEFSIALSYIRELEFEEAPDYKFLRGLFVNMMDNYCFEMDNVFDWNEFYDLNKSVKRDVVSEQTIQPIRQRYEEDKQYFSKFNWELSNEKHCLSQNNLQVPMSKNEIYQNSFGTSKIMHCSLCDLEEVDNEERTINKFYKNDNLKPKFFGKDKSNITEENEALSMEENNGNKHKKTESLQLFLASKFCYFANENNNKICYNYN